MNFRRIATALSVVIVASTIVFIAAADHEERLPQVYYSLDKSKAWNELAGSLDPQMSDGEYNKMRTRYFYDIVAPKLSDRSETFAAYQEFMRITERPWKWNRRSSRGEPPRIIQVVFWVCASYLVVTFLLWTWRCVLRPAGQIVRDDGLVGIAEAVLHGRRSRTGNLGHECKGVNMATKTFCLVRFDEGGTQGQPSNRRLVCVIESGGKLAIWGQEAPARNMRNIDSVLKVGVPCTIECEYRDPEEWAAQQFGHTHWVPQDYPLHVITTSE